MRRLARGLGWIAAAYVAFVTLSPIRYRPQTGHPNLERFAAFFLIGAAFSLGYPTVRRRVSAMLVLGAAALEAGQLFVPGRDAHISDAGVKALGALAGLTLAALAEHRLVGRSGSPAATA